MKTRYKYIEFFKIPPPRQQKTEVWVCCNIRSGGELGRVKWYSQWRQYCFFTEADCRFSSGCHIDIADFLAQMNKGHKAKNRKEAE